MTKLYLVTFEAEVAVQVEADNEEDAESRARTAFTWRNVTIQDVLDVDLIQGDDDDE